jgi:hypothetical protein
MNLADEKENIGIVLKKLLRSKFFKYAFIFQISYLILSIVLTLIIFRNQNDFKVYYKVGEVFINDLGDLYNKVNYDWPFRYLPLSALFFIPFYLMGFDIGFIFFNLVNFLLNLLICYFLYKIITIKNQETTFQTQRDLSFYLSIFLIGLPQLFNYILGQINLYISLLMLLSLYLFIKHNDLKWQFISSIILGITIIFKPITLFLLPFLIYLRYNPQSKRVQFKIRLSVYRVIGFLIPLSLNAIIFLLVPSLLEGFIYVNFTGTDAILINHSISLTKIISNLLFTIGFTNNQLASAQIPLFLAIAAVFGISSFLIYFFRREKEESIIYGFTFGILIMFIAYFDTWDHHLLNLIPLLIIIIIENKNKFSIKYLKISLYFFSFLDLAFMGLFFITAILLSFPFNFMGTIFLFITFYAICKLNLVSKKIIPAS